MDAGLRMIADTPRNTLRPRQFVSDLKGKPRSKERNSVSNGGDYVIYALRSDGSTFKRGRAFDDDTARKEASIMCMTPAVEVCRVVRPDGSEFMAS